MISAVIAIALQGATAPAASQAPAPAATGADKLICKRFAETGSFVRKTKVCRSKAEWNRLEEAAREEGGRMQNQLSTQRGG